MWFCCAGVDIPAKGSLKITFRNIGIGSNNYFAAILPFTRAVFWLHFNYHHASMRQPSIPNSEPLQVHAGHRWLPVWASSSRWMSKNIPEISQTAAEGEGTSNSEPSEGEKKNHPSPCIYFASLFFSIVEHFNITVSPRKRKEEHCQCFLIHLSLDIVSSV